MRAVFRVDPTEVANLIHRSTDSRVLRPWLGIAAASTRIDGYLDFCFERRLFGIEIDFKAADPIAGLIDPARGAPGIRWSKLQRLEQRFRIGMPSLTQGRLNEGAISSRSRAANRVAPSLDVIAVQSFSAQILSLLNAHQSFEFDYRLEFARRASLLRPGLLFPLVSFTIALAPLIR